jgi:hypothetical protein
MGEMEVGMPVEIISKSELSLQLLTTGTPVVLIQTDLLFKLTFSFLAKMS